MTSVSKTNEGRAPRWPGLASLAWGLLAVFVLGFAVAAPFISAVPLPFAFSFFIGALLMFVLAFLARRQALLSGSFLALFAIFLGLAAGEVFFFLRGHFSAVANLVDKGSYTTYFNTADPDLGYAPFANRTVEDTRTANGAVVFHAKYTIGPGAFRVTPGNPKSSETDVFFGDSFTFGEGLNDDQTLPAQYSKARGYDTNVLNLAFHGYGPHQMLRAIEIHRFAPYMTGHVKHVFFQTIGSHTERATGLVPWDLNGPRYVLDPKTGEPKFTGRFSDYPTRMFDQRFPVLNRSLVVQILANYFFLRPSQADVDLLVGIFEKSARLMAERYGADFTLLVWDYDPYNGDPTGAKIADEAERRGLHVVRVTTLLPDWRSDFKKRFLIPIDGHPTAYTNELFGKALANMKH